MRRSTQSADDIYAGPIRGELLGADHLAERARTVARHQRPERRTTGRRSAKLLSRLRESRDILDDARERLTDAAAAGADIGPAGEWLLDNFHVVEDHVREVRESLPRQYYRELPQLSEGPLAGYPRVYELAVTLISHREGKIDLENVDLFVAAFQQVTPLSIGELWAIPAMLRLGLIESVRRMALRTVQRLDEVEEADRWATRIHNEQRESSSSIREAFDAFVSAGHDLTPTFVSRFLRQLRVRAGAQSPLLWVEHWISDEGLSADDAAARSSERLALTTLMMANSITSLRAIGQRDWRQFVEHQSVMERALAHDPSHYYTRMTFGTRDRYRHSVERIAKRVRLNERVIAERAIQFARTHEPGDRRSHVGYYLVDDGVTQLERAVGYRAPLREALHRTALRLPNAVFVGGMLILTVVALGALYALAGDIGRSGGLAVLLLGFIPANDIAVNVINQLVTALVPPREVARLDLRESGVPTAFRTAVVVPTLFENVKDVETSLNSLEIQYLANRGVNVHFALLGDFVDAVTETQDTDAPIIAAARAGIEALNDQYAPDTRDAFYIFHRPRLWNPGEGRWMGWERKRGKLAEFNHFLRGGAPSAFVLIAGNIETIRGVQFVITLDADTLLPPGAAARLIGALAHPLNRPVFDEQRRIVVEGYGILQPRVGVSLASAHRSRFAAAQSGHPGVDPYTTAVSDVYQDLYGEGSFTGKGIYDVDAFERATLGRFPENALLSHDLIEGNYARAGLVTDVSVYDDYPATYLTYSRRKHRWIRGDWQLLRWLGRRVPGPGGREQNRLSVLSRWKILDNLRRSVIEIAQLAFFVAGWTMLPGSPLRWTFIGAAALAAPWGVSLLLVVLRPPRDRSWRAYYRAAGQDAMEAAQQIAVRLIFLPHQACLSADAIVRALWRQFVSKRRLLQWQPAALAERVSTRDIRRVWRAMWPAVSLVGLMLAATALHVTRTMRLDDPRLLPLALTMAPLCVLWIISPWVAHTLSEPVVHVVAPLSDDARAIALRYARAHWHYFDHFVSAETNWLAPDNVQVDPEPVVVAMRTSPTNIGLQLLATTSAHDLGFITLSSMVDRLEAAFATLEKLPRHRGHFYNWYDVGDLRVLEPAYISTVDSGNLAGHFIALQQACLAFVEQDDAAPFVQRLTDIAAHAERYVREMEFGFLFDGTRKLFAIGYHPGSHSLDNASYDLLASEARLASFVAIAKGDVPIEHWFRLGRTLTYASGETALVSWSGSMFEYLMPVLIMRSYPLTVLGETYRASVARQKSYALERGVPWGMSESAYNSRDRHATYQYRAFGVPDLALKRDLASELVVAPYATALAGMIDASAAVVNLQRFERMGLLAEYGFYDAIDFTRPDPDQTYATVRNFMAHHVGMTIVALTNMLLDRRWQRRFHTNPAVCAVALLLDERVPRKLDVVEARDLPENVRPQSAGARKPVVREVETPDTAQPHVALLGHAPFTLMVSHAGGGYSRYEDLAVTRWRADGTSDRTGQACYVKDVSTGRIWSAAHQPVCAPADWYRALLATDRVTLHRGDGDIDTRTEIVVVPEDSAEVRQVTVSNNGGEVRELELTSYGEIVLATPMADRVHPAFGNLFVETEWHEWCTAVTATRRPRSATERTLWCVHVAARGDARVGTTTCETDRSVFIGRGRSTRDPIVMETNGALPGTTGAVLDPVFALRVRVRLDPGESASVCFTTVVATSKERAMQLADRYHDPYATQRALDLAWTSAQIELEELGITPADVAVFQDLAGHLLYPTAAMRARTTFPHVAPSWQQALWANGISGDWPIVLAIIDSEDGLSTLQELFAAHRYWRRHGMTVDLVVVDEHRHSYVQVISDQVRSLMSGVGASGVAEGPGGIFIRRRDTLSAESMDTIIATARAVINCDGRTLLTVLTDATSAADPDLRLLEIEPVEERGRHRETPAHGSAVDRFLSRTAAIINRQFVADPIVPSERTPRPEQAAPASVQKRVSFANGYGGLTADGNYQISVNGDRVPPAPWVNVVANANGGFIVSERGAGFTWAGSSYFYRLTPWHNDPVSDPMTEVLYLRDEETRDVWTATPAPMRRDEEFLVEHAPGWTSFAHTHREIDVHLTLGVAPVDAVKISIVRLTNRGRRPRRLSLTSYAEWALGVLREQTQDRVRTSFDSARGAIFARNQFDPQYSGWVAFCAMSEVVAGHTGDRHEFIGRNGSLANPAALRRDTLHGATGFGYDTCAALQCTIDLAPGQTREVSIILGAMSTREASEQAVDKYRKLDRARAAIAETKEAWTSRLSAITVTTPDASFDSIVNRWSLYQALACRMWARSALYQSSGAYGFRDQLQDVMAFVYAEPQLAREHILRAAARQFSEGDVQHWWHAESGRGIRTRFSDDLAWLPYVVEHYTRTTGEASVLDELVPFLSMRPLEPHEHEVYDLPKISTESGTVYEHCLRAIDKACTAGEHGLPLMGGGDWNDGMNRVGAEGKGESVWLAWFLISMLRGFAPLVAARGDAAKAAELEKRADAYAGAANENAWDGAWYRRAYFDDGTPLGSASSDECKIDSIAQSWSVISGAGDPARRRQAMRSFEQHLVMNDARLLMLLTPPFHDTLHDPGYIKGYIPGVRENGAQYTHAALWAVLATALEGDGDRAFELYQMINPFTHASTPEQVATYKVEPYVIAADVYTADHALGRGGWTWYTGSASWMYRVALESILGFTKVGNTLRVDPCVPRAWPEMKIEYRFGTSTYEITVHNPGQRGQRTVTVDGVESPDSVIRLNDDRQRHVVVIDPRTPERAP